MYLKPIILKHESYDPYNIKNDIALLILQNEVTLSNEIQTAFLPPNSYPDVNSTAYVVGWGSVVGDTSKPILPSILQNAKVNVYESVQCSICDSTTCLIPNNFIQICAGI